MAELQRFDVLMAFKIFNFSDGGGTLLLLRVEGKKT